MSGTLLLISKNDQNTQLFLSKIKQLEKFTNNTFGKYFKNIIFRKPNKNCYLIEFRQDKKKKFYIDENGNWLCFEGTVFALNESNIYNAEELLKLYKKIGEGKLANKLDGHFVVKIYDARNNHFLIINDYIKYKINFITENKDFMLFTPLLLTVGIINKPKLDQYALNEFLWRYSYISEKTILKNVKRLSPASIYKIKNGEMTVKTYWEWPRQYGKFSFKHAVEKTMRTMKETVRLISNSFGKPCIDFTMGQDSRMIISAFTNQKLPFITSTFGKEDFFEVKSVKDMSKRNHIENHNIRLTKEYLDNLWEHFHKAVILGNCGEPGYLLGRILFTRSQQMKYSNVLLNGSDGQFYKNGLWIEMYTFSLYREPRKVNIEMFLKLRVLSKNYLEDIFNENYLKIKHNSKQYFRNLIQNTIKDYMDSPVAIQMDRFSLYYWTNFLNTANNAVSMLTNSISPLLLRRNLELALTAPVKWKFHSSQYQRSIVYGLNPSLAKEKTDMGGINMVPKNIFTYIPFWFRYFFFQSKRLRNKIKTILGIPVDTELQEAWDYLPIYKLLFQDENFQKNLIYENMYLSEIIEENEWNKFIKKFQNKDFQTLDNFEYLFKIISVEYFLQKASNL